MLIDDKVPRFSRSCLRKTVTDGNFDQIALHLPLKYGVSCSFAVMDGVQI
jgi:hypothetical protein